MSSDYDITISGMLTKVARLFFFCNGAWQSGDETNQMMVGHL